MAKSKKLCKKPLLILSLCLVAVFAAALIIMAVVPYAATPYKYVRETNYSTQTIKYYVSKDSVKVKTVTVDNEGDKSTNIETYDAYVKDGALYVDVSGTGLEFLTAKHGNIDSYNLVISEDVVFENTFTKVLKIVSIVGVSLGGVGLVLYFVLNNKNGKTKKSSKKK